MCQFVGASAETERTERYGLNEPVEISAITEQYLSAKLAAKGR